MHILSPTAAYGEAAEIRTSSSQTRWQYWNSLVAVRTPHTIMYAKNL